METYEEMAERFRREGASETAIWMAENGQAVEFKAMLILQDQFLKSLLPKERLKLDYGEAR